MPDSMNFTPAEDGLTASVERQYAKVLSDEIIPGKKGGTLIIFRALSPLQLSAALKSIWGSNPRVHEFNQFASEGSDRAISFFSNSLMILLAALQLRRGSGPDFGKHLPSIFLESLPEWFMDFARSRTIDILLVFSAELALKSLLEKEEKWDKRFQTHDIELLFNSLSDGYRERILHGFDSVKSGGKDLPTVLANHRHDFEKWRYMDDVDELHSEPDAIQGLTFAALSEYLRPSKKVLFCSDCNAVIIDEQDIDDPFDDTLIERHQCIRQYRENQSAEA